MKPYLRTCALLLATALSVPATALLAFSPRTAPPNLSAVQPPTALWTTSGPYGGEVLALAGDGKGVLYAGARQGIFVSRDWGVSWTVRSNGLAGSSVQDLVVDSRGNAYAATDRGLYRKANNSLNWTRIGPDDFYLSVVVDGSGGVFAGGYRTGLAVSLNRGQSWLLRPPTTPPVAVNRLAVDGNGVVYAGTEAGVFVTRDAGVSWDAHALGQNDSVTALVVASTANGDTTAILYAGTKHGAVYISKDSGATWERYSSYNLSSPVTALLVNPDGSVTAGARDGLWTSTTGGPWVRQPAIAAPVNRVMTLGGRTFLATANGALTFTEGQWRSLDSGIWARSIRALTAGPGRAVVAAAREGLFFSANSGASWSAGDSPESQIACLAAGPKNEFYAGVLTSADGIAVVRSNDGGRTWKAASGGLPASGVYSLAVSPDGSALAGMESGIYLTRDHGVSWTAVSSEPAHSILALSDHLLLAASRNGVFRSTDGGMHWTNSSVGLISSHAEYLAGVQSRVLASSGPNFYLSNDGGLTWRLRSVAPDGVGPMELQAGPGGSWYAADLQSGVWRSDDDGAHWKQASASLFSPYIASLAVGPEGTVYAGLNGASVWTLRSSQTRISVAPGAAKR